MVPKQMGTVTTPSWLAKWSVKWSITKKPLCFIGLQIIISIIALDQNYFVKASSAQLHTKDYWHVIKPGMETGNEKK